MVRVEMHLPGGGRSVRSDELELRDGRRRLGGGLRG